jgi:7,8-dihydropterin-6-yl-methyl-4-(beta-D-ribofuranosyl)aminobenzene 5'-phosphate synthase
MEKHQRNIELKILYDNEALKDFRKGFGFSCWIEDKNILFDTGGDSATLMFNIQKFMINPKNIEKDSFYLMSMEITSAGSK